MLDPFVGSGTTTAVAFEMKRRYLGIELNPEYVKMARQRTYIKAPLFASEDDS